MIDKRTGREILSPADRQLSDGTGLDLPNVTDHAGGPLIHPSLTDAKAASRASDGSGNAGER